MRILENHKALRASVEWLCCSSFLVTDADADSDPIASSVAVDFNLRRIFAGSSMKPRQLTSTAQEVHACSTAPKSADHMHPSRPEASEHDQIHMHGSISLKL